MSLNPTHCTHTSYLWICFAYKLFICKVTCDYSDCINMVKYLDDTKSQHLKVCWFWAFNIIKQTELAHSSSHDLKGYMLCSKTFTCLYVCSHLNSSAYCNHHFNVRRRTKSKVFIPAKMHFKVYLKLIRLTQTAKV